MNTIQELEAAYVTSLAQKIDPGVRPGDTLRVQVRIVEGDRERLQAFEGVCIGRRNAG